MAFAQCLGNKLGTLVSCEVDTMFAMDKSLCFMVNMDVTKPLVQDVNGMGYKAALWVKLIYIKLPEFWYGYGHLGHVLKGCDTIDLDIKEGQLRYGD